MSEAYEDVGELVVIDRSDDRVLLAPETPATCLCHDQPWHEPVANEEDGAPTIPAPPPIPVPPLTADCGVWSTSVRQDCKQDSGKPDLHLLPPEAWLLELTLEELEGVARVREYGDRKYAPNSWRAVENAVPRYRAAGLRHVAAMAAGEELDPESGLPHRHHALCNAVLVLAHIAGGGR